MDISKVGQLCYWMVNQPEGKVLLETLSYIMANDPIFPKPKELLDSFGGAECFMAFRAGQVSLVKYIELHATGYKDHQNALLAKSEKEAAKEPK